jgi:hypothetical protein
VSAGRCRSVTGAWLAGALGCVTLTMLGAAPGSGAATSAPPLGAVVVPALGPGYAVTADGEYDVARIAAAWPNPSTIATALYQGAADAAYERTWLAQGGANEVVIVLLRFASAAGAQAFTTSADRTLVSSHAVTSGTVPSVRDARQTTYVSSAGLGEAVVERAGAYAALLSFVSATAADAAPITAGDVQRVAAAQDAAMVRAPGGSSPAAGNGPSATDLTWAVLAVGVMAVGLATPLVLRRRRERGSSSQDQTRIAGDVGGWSE